jgi:hypothetical protein
LHRIDPSISLESHPWSFHIPHDGLTAFVDVHVLDRHLLLAFATVAMERFKQRR